MINPDDLILDQRRRPHLRAGATCSTPTCPRSTATAHPRVVEEDDGVEQWWYGDLRGRNIGLERGRGQAAASIFNLDAVRYDEMRPGLLRRRTSACAT